MKLVLDPKKRIYTFDRQITNISDYLLALESIAQEMGQFQCWFRGMAQKSFKLLPSCARGNDWKYNRVQEYSLIVDFIHRARVHEKMNHDIWGWYSICQHHGIPTRLLDWSESALSALYFAIEEDGDTNPVVWALNPWILNKASTGHPMVCLTDDITCTDEDKKLTDQYKVGTVNLPDNPLAIIPPHIDSRIGSQKGCFTIHGKNRNAFYDLSINPEVAPFLVRIDINPEAKKNIRGQLITLGIDSYTIYPDLDGLAQALKWHHSNHGHFDPNGVI